MFVACLCLSDCRLYLFWESIISTTCSHKILFILSFFTPSSMAYLFFIEWCTLNNGWCGNTRSFIYFGKLLLIYMLWFCPLKWLTLNNKKPLVPSATFSANFTKNLQGWLSLVKTNFTFLFWFRKLHYKVQCLLIFTIFLHFLKVSFIFWQTLAEFKFGQFF